MCELRQTCHFHYICFLFCCLSANSFVNFGVNYCFVISRKLGCCFCSLILFVCLFVVSLVILLPRLLVFGNVCVFGVRLVWFFLICWIVVGSCFVFFVIAHVMCFNYCCLCFFIYCWVEFCLQNILRHILWNIMRNLLGNILPNIFNL